MHKELRSPGTSMDEVGDEVMQGSLLTVTAVRSLSPTLSLSLDQASTRSKTPHVMQGHLR